jgi:hypothetical protein
MLPPPAAIPPPLSGSHHRRAENHYNQPVWNADKQTNHQHYRRVYFRHRQNAEFFDSKFVHRILSPF